MTGGPSGPCWLRVIRRYLIAITLGNLLWETAQLPLYTLSRAGSRSTILKALLHCTAGDVIITSTALIMALALLGSTDWPRTNRARIGLAVGLMGTGYTIWSEYLNTVLRSSWACTEFMPTLPIIGTGLAPLAQWLVVPMLALAWAYRPRIRDPQIPAVRPRRVEVVPGIRTGV